MRPAISFITISRDRNSQEAGFIHTIQSNYSDCEIIIAAQQEEGLFKHGQLRNLGYKKSQAPLVVFMDIDVRFLDKLDFEVAMYEHNHPLLMFDKSFVVEERNLVVYRRPRYITHCIGRLICFTREQFEACGGYSNLCLGWGWEDNLLYERAKLKKIPGRIGHIIHPEIWGEEIHQKQNKYIFQTDNERQPELDGFRQTVAGVRSLEQTNNIHRYNFSKITVPADFAYRDLLVNRRTV